MGKPYRLMFGTLCEKKQAIVAEYCGVEEEEHKQKEKKNNSYK